MELEDSSLVDLSLLLLLLSPLLLLPLSLLLRLQFLLGLQLGTLRFFTLTFALCLLLA